MRRAIRDNDQRAAVSVLMLKNGVREQSESLLARKSAWQLGCISAVTGRATRPCTHKCNSQSGRVVIQASKLWEPDYERTL